MMHRFFQTVQRKLEHGKYTRNLFDRPGVKPGILVDWIEPDTVTEGFRQKFEIIERCSGVVLADIDRTARIRQFIGRHRGIPDDDEPGFGIGLHEFVHMHGPFVTVRIKPDFGINGIVENNKFPVP